MNDETKNYNDFDVFEFRSTIRKRDFYRFNNSFENWFRTHNKTTHRTIVRRRFVNWRFDRSINETKSKTSVRCEQHNIVRSKYAKSKFQIFIASNDKTSIIRNKLKKSFRSKFARCQKPFTVCMKKSISESTLIYFSIVIESISNVSIHARINSVKNFSINSTTNQSTINFSNATNDLINVSIDNSINNSIDFSVNDSINSIISKLIDIESTIIELNIIKSTVFDSIINISIISKIDCVLYLRIYSTKQIV